MSKIYTYEKEYRHTRLNGLTISIAICLECKKVIEPTRKYRSKTKTHGKDYYVHEHPLLFITLVQSNRGYRVIGVPKELEDMYIVLERLWVYEGKTVEEIIEYIKSYLAKM
jgi:hypothetical protein